MTQFLDEPSKTDEDRFHILGPCEDEVCKPPRRVPGMQWVLSKYCQGIVVTAVMNDISGERCHCAILPVREHAYKMHNGPCATGQSLAGSEQSSMLSCPRGSPSPW